MEFIKKRIFDLDFAKNNNTYKSRDLFNVLQNSNDFAQKLDILAIIGKRVKATKVCLRSGFLVPG